MSWDGTRYHHRALTPLGELLKSSRQDPTIGFFWCLVLLHVLFWTILSTVTQPNLPSQTLDLLTSGQDFAWGYATHPPLGVWLATAMRTVAAPSNWPVYLLSQLCGVVSVWGAWKLGREFLHPWTALCAAFVLLGGYSCTIASAAFTGDHLASAFWSLAIYFFHSALTQERRRYWAATGLCLALGFLSSYGTFLLLLTMFIFTLIDDRARRCWDSSWPFLAGMAMAAMLMPHVVWLAKHQFQTVQAGLERSSSVAQHLVEPLSYLGTQLLCVIPVIVLLAPLVAWFSFEEPAQSEEDDREFARRYLLWMTCLPPAIIFGLSLVAGPSSSLFAGVTNWSYLGVVFLMWGHLSETRLAWRRSIIRIGAAVGMFAAALIALNLMLPQIQNDAAITQFPGADLAQQIEKLWIKAGYQGRIPVIAGPAHLVRNAAWYAHRDFPMKSYADLNPLSNEAVNDQTLLREGGIVVWRMRNEETTVPSDLTERFGRFATVQPVDLKWQTDASLPAVRVGMALVHPAGIVQPPVETTPPVYSYQPAVQAPVSPAAAEIAPTFTTSNGTVIQAWSQSAVKENPAPQAPVSTPDSLVLPTLAPQAEIREVFPPSYPAANYRIPQSEVRETSALDSRSGQTLPATSRPEPTLAVPTRTEPVSAMPQFPEPVAPRNSMQNSTVLPNETRAFPVVPELQSNPKSAQQPAQRSGWTEQ